MGCEMMLDHGVLPLGGQLPGRERRERKSKRDPKQIGIEINGITC